MALAPGAVYVAGHPHYCGNVGAFPQTEPWTFNRGLAFTREPTGVVGTDPLNYPNFAGKPAPTQLHWYPDINAGTYTGQSQGPWSIAANDSYVVYGGEFTQVNGKAQQGLVRFAVKSLATNKDGPRLGGSATGLATRSYGSSGIRVSWPANYDRDNERLRYRLYRGGQLVYETITDSAFYRRPLLSYLDRNVSAGQSYTYKLRVSDPLDNVAWSSEVTGTAGSGTALTRYQSQVLSDGPESYWTMNDGPGTVMADLLGKDNGTHGALVTTGAGGAISGEPGTSFRFAGTGSTSVAGDTVSQTSPASFSTEAWFMTSSITGGHIIGLDSSSTGGGSFADRHIYLSNEGRVFFAVKPSNTIKSVSSSATYRDSQWHHVVGTLSAEGLKLYVDGQLVGHSEITQQALQFRTRPAYWRIGGDTLTGYPSKPTSNYLAGHLDEVAVYPVALTAATIKDHYNLGKLGVAPNVAPSAAFTATPSGLSVSVDGSASTDSDGTVASYAWTFGDGTTGTGKTATHTYQAAGTYDVTLVVTDDKGAASPAATKQVTVTEPPNQDPTAAFSVSTNDLTVAVDASASEDPDGTVSQYAWEFGDGSTGSGVTANHTYNSPGSYVVGLTVTDDDGATDNTTKVVTVPAGAEPFVYDDFNRTLASGLGSADLGGAWTTSAASGFAVANGDGIFKLTAPGANRTAYLAGASRTVRTLS